MSFKSLHSISYSFEPLHQRICLNSQKMQDTNWPPKKPTNNSSIRADKRSHFDLKLTCGDSEGRFEFGLYKFVDPSSTSGSFNKQVGGTEGHMTPAAPPPEEDKTREAALLQHHVVDIS